MIEHLNVQDFSEGLFWHGIGTINKTKIYDNIHICYSNSVLSAFNTDTETTLWQLPLAGSVYSDGYNSGRTWITYDYKRGIICLAYNKNSLLLINTKGVILSTLTLDGTIQYSNISVHYVGGMDKFLVLCEQSSGTSKLLCVDAKGNIQTFYSVASSSPILSVRVNALTKRIILQGRLAFSGTLSKACVYMDYNGNVLSDWSNATTRPNNPYSPSTSSTTNLIDVNNAGSTSHLLILPDYIFGKEAIYFESRDSNISGYIKYYGSDGTVISTRMSTVYSSTTGAIYGHAMAFNAINNIIIVPNGKNGSSNVDTRIHIYDIATLTSIKTIDRYDLYHLEWSKGKIFAYNNNTNEALSIFDDNLNLIKHIGTSFSNICDRLYTPMPLVPNTIFNYDFYRKS